MTPDFDKAAIYIKPGVTDMRKQISTLSVYVVEEMKKESLSGDIYVFCNRDRSLIKALYWERNGFCLWQKRLEKDKFPWPKTEAEARKITRDELMMLLSGIDFFKAHQSIQYSSVS